VINPNGSPILSVVAPRILSTAREAMALVYVDSTQGWLPYDGYNASIPGFYNYNAQFWAVAGGGGGGPGGNAVGGGGAGGVSATTTYSLSTGSVYTVTIGAGGVTNTNGNNTLLSGSGISTVTAIGGGHGGGPTASGGSGGGGTATGPGGGTPGTAYAGSAGTVGQGYAGGSGQVSGGNYDRFRGGGGGGASGAGPSGGGGTSPGLAGGPGVTIPFQSSTVYAAAGGCAGCAGWCTCTTPYRQTPQQGSGSGSYGGGGAFTGNGGPGLAILVVPTSKYSGVTTGSPTVTTCGSNTIMTFTSSGSYTA
jgi:hypothetical protein